MNTRQPYCGKGHRTTKDSDMYITVTRGKVRRRCRICQLKAAHDYYNKHHKKQKKKPGRLKILRSGT